MFDAVMRRQVVPIENSELNLGECSYPNAASVSDVNMAAHVMWEAGPREIANDLRDVAQLWA